MAVAGFGGRVEGVHAVAAALAAGRVEKLSIARARRASPELAPLLAAAAEAGVALEVVDDLGSLATTDAPQGVVASARAIPYVDLRTAVAACDPAAVIVLDHVEDPRNVGAIARSAVAGGFRAMVVPTRRAAPLGATALKAAAGAFEHLAVVSVSSIADAVARLRDLDVWVVGLTADGAQSLMDLELLGAPVAIVLGAEGSGLSRLVSERVDLTVSIPLAGPVESLNVSVAAALAIFEAARVRGRAS